MKLVFSLCVSMLIATCVPARAALPAALTQMCPSSPAQQLSGLKPHFRCWSTKYFLHGLHHEKPDPSHGKNANYFETNVDFPSGDPAYRYVSDFRGACRKDTFSWWKPFGPQFAGDTGGWQLEDLWELSYHRDGSPATFTRFPKEGKKP